MKKIFFLILLFISSVSFAQNLRIKGRVIDESGIPVVFATVTLKNTKVSVATNQDGFFDLRVPSLNVTLEISMVGFEPQIIVYEKTDLLVVTLKRSSQMLNEVVVTTFSIQRKREMTYATSSVQNKSLNDDQTGFKTWKRSGISENSVRLSVGDKDNIPLKSVQTAVQIDGFRARVLFDFFFYSDKTKRLRGDFQLKLPNGASPFYFAFGKTIYLNKNTKAPLAPFVQYSSYAPLALNKDSVRKQRMNVPNNLKEAIVAPKEKAVYAFNEVVRGNIDPALLEWAGADVFSCSVFPIEPSQLHHVVIGYDINLLEIGEDAVLNLALPFEKIEKKLDIDIASTEGLRQKITPMPATPAFSQGHIKYHTDKYNDKEFTIAIHSGKNVFLKDREESKYFAVSYKPEIPFSPSVKFPEDAVFMLDVSLSSQPDKMYVWLKTLEGILNNNRDQIKRFAVLYFNVDANWWKPAFIRNNGYNVDSFLSYANRLSLLGATDLYNALKEGAHPQWLNGKKIPKSIFLLSDGDASWGENNLYRLSDLIDAGDKVYSFTTGFAETDTRILDHLSRQTNGAVFSVLNEEEVTKVSKAIQTVPWRIQSLTLDGGKDLLIAGRPYNIFDGQKLIISGRSDIKPDSKIMLTLEQNGTVKTFDIQPSQVISSSLTKRIYGQTAVNQLEDFSFKTEKEAVKYATYFEIPGQNCSMVMLESKEFYHRFGLDSSSTAAFVDTSLVTNIINNVLIEEKKSASLGNAKADMRAWLQKLKRDGVIVMGKDSSFEKHFEELPESAFNVDVPNFKAGLITNDQWFGSSLRELSKSTLNYEDMLKAADNEKRFEGKGNGFKLLSSFAEKNRGDITLMRDLAYVLSTWNMDGKSYELLKRIVMARPAEPATYILIANSLVKMQKTDLAMVWYDLAFFTYWDNRFAGMDLISALQYSKLLNEIKEGKYKVADPAFVKKRSTQMNDFLDEYHVDSSGVYLMVAITWNTDNTDVDLHMREPLGEECYYGRRSTKNGGYLSNDATQGFGPEMYIIKNAPKGAYHLDIDYYAESRVRTTSQSKVMIDAYKNWGRSNEKHIRKTIVLKTSKKRSHNDREDENDKLIKDALVITIP